MEIVYLANDLGENNDLATQHPDVLQILVDAYDKYASDVGVIMPRAESFETTAKNNFPPVNQENVQTINLANNFVPGYPLNDTGANQTYTMH